MENLNNAPASVTGEVGPTSVEFDAAAAAATARFLAKGKATPPLEATEATEATEAEVTESPLVPDAPVADMGSFPSAPTMKGEFTLPLSCLEAGSMALRRDYDFTAGLGKSLLNAALVPETIAPLLVIKVGNRWHVVDGWARVEAFRQQHGRDADVQIRVLEWAGTEKDALLVRFQQTFLSLGSKKIEIAYQLRQVADLWSVPQLVLAARIGWTESKVSKHLIAAEIDEKHPRFKLLLEKADNPPIDYLYTVGKKMREAEADDAKHPRRAAHNGKVAALVDRLEALLAKPDRFKPADALIALALRDAPDPDTTPLPIDTDPKGPLPSPVVDVVEIEPIVGHDDQPVAMVEVHGDGQTYVHLLIDASTMTAIERAAARTEFRAFVDRLYA